MIVFVVLVGNQRVFFGFCVHHLVSFIRRVECVQRFRIKYKLVRKYYDNAATVVVAARCCCCCSVLFIRCVLRSGKYYIHFNFRFPSFFSLSRSRRFFIVTFLPITHFIYSYSCNRRVSAIHLNQRESHRDTYTQLSIKVKKPNSNFQQSLHLFHILFPLSHMAIEFNFIKSHSLCYSNHRLWTRTNFILFNKCDSRIPNRKNTRHFSIWFFVRRGFEYRSKVAFSDFM